jgi:hypothetical protein
LAAFGFKVEKGMSQVKTTASFKDPAAKNGGGGNAVDAEEDEGSEAVEDEDEAEFDDNASDESDEDFANETTAAGGALADNDEGSDHYQEAAGEDSGNAAWAVNDNVEVREHTTHARQALYFPFLFSLLTRGRYLHPPPFLLLAKPF